MKIESCLDLLKLVRSRLIQHETYMGINSKALVSVQPRFARNASNEETSPDDPGAVAWSFEGAFLTEYCDPEIHFKTYDHIGETIHRLGLLVFDGYGDVYIPTIPEIGDSTYKHSEINCWASNGNTRDSTIKLVLDETIKRLEEF